VKVNIGIEISDAQRNLLASLLAGKPVKRLATRDQVRDFVSGVIGSLDAEVNELVTNPPEEETPVSQSTLTPAEERIFNRLVLVEGKSADYARGFISAGRVLAKAGHSLRVTS
jgi:hypothetical protein